MATETPRDRATDADIIKIARKIDDLNSKILYLVEAIEESGHPNAETIVSYINNDLNVPVPAFFPIEIHDLLEHPDKWEANARRTDLVRKTRIKKQTTRRKRKK